MVCLDILIIFAATSQKDMWIMKIEITFIIFVGLFGKKYGIQPVFWISKAWKPSLLTVQYGKRLREGSLKNSNCCHLLQLVLYASLDIMEID